MPRPSSCDVSSLLSRLAERPRVWPKQQEWLLAELAVIIEQSDRMTLGRVQAALAPDTLLGLPGATRLLLGLVHDSIPPAAMLSSDLAQQELVAAQACRVIHGMISGHKGLHASVVDGGVVPLMAMVLIVAANAATHVRALSTLGAVLRSSDPAVREQLREAATDAGVADATLCSLRAHPASSEVQQRGMEVLAALVVDGGAPACAALQAGCVDAAASALRHGRLAPSRHS